MSQAKMTTDHDEIRQWVEARGGRPATVKRTAGRGGPGILRIDFPGFSGDDALAEISWDEFFRAFDANGLAFVYQDDPESRFGKLVDRESIRATPRRRESSRPPASSRPPKSPRGRSRRTSH